MPVVLTRSLTWMHSAGKPGVCWEAWRVAVMASFYVGYFTEVAGTSGAD